MGTENKLTKTRITFLITVKKVSMIMKGGVVSSSGEKLKPEIKFAMIDCCFTLTKHAAADRGKRGDKLLRRRI